MRASQSSKRKAKKKPTAKTSSGSKSRPRKKSSIPESYVVFPGCHNCVHCFILADHEEEAQYFCTYKAPKRPLCGSIWLGEAPGVASLTKPGQRRWATLVEKWEKWASQQEVAPWGCCNVHKKRAGDHSRAKLIRADKAFPLVRNTTETKSSTTNLVFDIRAISVRQK